MGKPTKPVIERLDYFVISIRTGNTIAGFLLLQHAINYAKSLRKEEGPHSPLYEVVDHKGNLVYTPYSE